ncbi:MAG: hypothetical protein QM734_00310 [Cyclobacteriaceae bacterium]
MTTIIKFTWELAPVFLFATFIFCSLVMHREKKRKIKHIAIFDSYGQRQELSEREVKKIFGDKINGFMQTLDQRGMTGINHGTKGEMIFIRSDERYNKNLNTYLIYLQHKPVDKSLLQKNYGDLV